MVANRLRRRFDADEAEIHVVDRDDRHVYQPGLLFVPFGLTSLDEIVRPRERQLRDGIVFHEREIDAVWIERDELLLDDGTTLPYDVLVVATGSRLQPEETEGLTGPGWNERAFTFYTPEGAAALRDGARALRRRSGRGQPRRHADQVPGRAARVRLPRRVVLPGARDQGPGRPRVLHAARRCVHEARRLRASGRPARREGDRARHRVQRRRGRLGSRQADLLRRPRARLRPARDRAAARRCSVRRLLARPGRRARLRPDRQEHAAVDGARRTSSRSGTRPTCRRRRRGR